jgi:uncharacterized protein with HEPN domain
VARLSEDVRNRHPDPPWRDIVAMRNALVHGYFDVDWDQLWVVVERDLANLERALEAILEAEATDA